MVDVVPAFPRPWWSNGGWDICDSARDSWISTNPKKHVELSASANRAQGGNLVPRIKQLKAWNRTANEPLRSFHLEALAWSIFGTTWFWKTNISSDWASARYFFDKAREKLRWQLNDPAGFGGDVGAYLTGTALETAISKVATAHERCEHAEKAARAHEFARMHEAYRRVFGDYYPTSWIRDALSERRR